MSKILNENLAISDIAQIFTSDLNEMYANPNLVSNEKKREIKQKALDLAGIFISDVILFYYQKNTMQISDEDFERLINNFTKFNKTLISSLNTMTNDKILYSGVSLLWTGIYTSLEKELKVEDDVSFLTLVQYLMIDLFKIQSQYFKSLKK